MRGVISLVQLTDVVMYHHGQVLSIFRMMDLIMAPETNLIKFPPLSLFVSGHTPAFASLFKVVSGVCVYAGYSVLWELYYVEGSCSRADLWRPKENRIHFD